MPDENTSLKNVNPAGDSNTSNEMVIGKSNTYQRPFLIVAGSLLTLLVWIVVTGKSGGPYFKSSAQEIVISVGAMVDYQGDKGPSASCLAYYANPPSGVQYGKSGYETEINCPPDQFVLGGENCGFPYNTDRRLGYCHENSQCAQDCCGNSKITDCCKCDLYCQKKCPCGKNDTPGPLSPNQGQLGWRGCEHCAVCSEYGGKC